MRPSFLRVIALVGISMSAACVDDARSPERARAAAAAIHGGAATTTCGFPTVAMLGEAMCTATLIHPEVLVYAAHCGTGFATAHFGESAANGFDRALASCEVHPDYSGDFGDEWDYALCRLAEPLDGLAIVPPLMGCETDVVVPDRPVVVVGFGLETTAGGGGVKREMAGVIGFLDFGGTSVNIDNVDEGAGACPGDSGGPTFVLLDDGTFRQLGVHQLGATSCGQGVNDKRLWMGVPWIESATGLDVTPCHDADGTWNPGPGCDGFPTAPGQGAGDWPACASGPLSGRSETCGASFETGSGGGGAAASTSASGSGGGGASAGGGGAAPSAGGGDDGGNDPAGGDAQPGAPADDGGCSCRSTPGDARSVGGLALAAGLLVARIIARRRCARGAPGREQAATAEP